MGKLITMWSDDWLRNLPQRKLEDLSKRFDGYQVSIIERCRANRVKLELILRERESTSRTSRAQPGVRE